MSLKVVQIGDVAVLDISATTTDQDGSGPQNIPSAETKGFPIFASAIFSSQIIWYAFIAFLT